MPRFRWTDWNLDKISAHALAFEEVEHAFEHRVGAHQERDDGSYETIGVTPSGRLIEMVWRYDEEIDPLEEGGTAEVVFVITAF